MLDFPPIKDLTDYPFLVRDILKHEPFSREIWQARVAIMKYLKGKITREKLEEVLTKAE